MIKFKLIIIFIFTLIITNSCTTLREGLSGKKRMDLMHLWLKKKNPLVIPKNYNELPEPVNNTNENLEDDFNKNAKLLFEKEFENKNENFENQSSNQDLENSIIKKIKNK